MRRRLVSVALRLGTGTFGAGDEAWEVKDTYAVGKERLRDEEGEISYVANQVAPHFFRTCMTRWPISRVCHDASLDMPVS
jgi:hypothetical protein